MSVFKITPYKDTGEEFEQCSDAEANIFELEQNCMWIAEFRFKQDAIDFAKMKMQLNDELIK